MDSTIKNTTADVETVNGVPIVVSQWGFRRIVLAGKTYLEAMTRDQLRTMLLSNKARSEHDVDAHLDDLAKGDCYSNGYTCVIVHPCRGCDRIDLGAGEGFYCTCNPKA
jgi:hypothetical protein